jgi:hypothetical protein
MTDRCCTVTFHRPLCTPLEQKLNGLFMTDLFRFRPNPGIYLNPGSASLEAGSSEESSDLSIQMKFQPMFISDENREL